LADGITALKHRSEAMLGLICARELDPELGLSYVVRPSAQIEQASEQGPRPYGERLEDALELVAEGAAQWEAGEKLGTGRFGIQQALRERDLQMRLPV
jgi:hypothetical protein